MRPFGSLDLPAQMAPEAGIEPTTNWLTVNCTTAVLLWNKTGCRGWIRTNDFMAYETRRMTTSILCDNLAMRGRIELPSSDRQSEIMTIIWTHLNLVETVRFEPTHPKEQIYSLPQLSHFAVSPNSYGRGTENWTPVNRLKAYYFATKLYPQIFYHC